MFKRNQSSVLDYHKKNRRKVLKTIMQTMILLAISVLLFRAVVDIEKYDEPDKKKWSNEKGFIALSYFGVDRIGTPKLIAKKELDKQLKALHDQGYQTISQQDVIDYYKKGRTLPDKALFLSFEDGRNDSSIFAHPLLKKYNYKATFLSYANKMGSSDHKFLQPKDMLKMMKSGYWELGSNGYRLTCINIFDDEGNYIGVRDENKLTNKKHIEYYNHFLMDFIRDENMIPSEDREEMETRIKKDYKLMKDIYSEQLGFVPNVYMIMHANALYGSMNGLVTNINDNEIKQLFNIHFNLEGNVYNTKEASLHNLTRVQPAPYWYTNHLLMKIQKDTGQKMEFILGDDERASKWEQRGGVTEFIDSSIVITSPPAKEGMLYLLNSEDYDDIKMTTNLSGNVVGKQSVYLRYDELGSSFLRITLDNNVVIISEKILNYAEKQLGKYELKEIEKNIEDITFDKATVYTKEQTAEGVRTPEDEHAVNIKQTRQFEISILEDTLTVLVDGELLMANQSIDSTINRGGVALASEFNKQNKKDDIYDAVFDDVMVSSIGGNNSEETIVFDNTDTGFQGVVNRIKESINNVTSWVIDVF